MNHLPSRFKSCTYGVVGLHIRKGIARDGAFADIVDQHRAYGVTERGPNGEPLISALSDLDIARGADAPMRPSTRSDHKGGV